MLHFQKSAHLSKFFIVFCAIFISPSKVGLPKSEDPTIREGHQPPLYYTHALSLIVLERHVLVCKSIFQITGILTKSVTLQQK